mmetsp:Transcript_105084/g.234553  ORF Transcript_105084/g.234553 Transcript_105084/m.234553 type:complete len:283 (+) Transcript_105084:1182-2030(+)
MQLIVVAESPGLHTKLRDMPHVHTGDLSLPRCLLHALAVASALGLVELGAGPQPPHLGTAHRHHVRVRTHGLGPRACGLDGIAAAALHRLPQHRLRGGPEALRRFAAAQESRGLDACRLGLITAILDGTDIAGEEHGLQSRLGPEAARLPAPPKDLRKGHTCRLRLFAAVLDLIRIAALQRAPQLGFRQVAAQLRAAVRYLGSTHAGGLGPQAGPLYALRVAALQSFTKRHLSANALQRLGSSQAASGAPQLSTMRTLAFMGLGAAIGGAHGSGIREVVSAS